ncbi:DUF4132 domain-containing protein [Actinomadura sp. WAC 06369]|uniref:DUF4132 domain-containing protein n=1 Tax=Actinomadura sp. WAC 06369 TaxID=2203193 RepID=UPI000F79ED5B|nr:DUF4132 domain-containing protein [Actinomadura sp. WAC 06369]RSN68281.1 hypothetical protein DMH08_11215 [Actinomadura sp. WAC 06369]
MWQDLSVIPASWRSRVHPRKDGPTAPDPAVDEALAGDVLRRVSGMRERLVEYIETCERFLFDEELIDPARAYLSGEADPVGAAATLVLLSDKTVASGFYGAAGPRTRTRFDGLADAWTAEHGLAFAASAFVELSGIGPRMAWPGTDDHCALGVHASIEHSLALLWDARHGGVRRMRELLTAADGAVLDRLGALRTTVPRGIVVSYLVPQRDAWLDECLVDPPTIGWEGKAAWMLWCCLGSAARFERARGVLHGGRYELVPDVLATVYAGAGPALVPVLGAALDGRPLAQNRDAVLTLLARMPYDEAFAVLVERTGDAAVRRALGAAARRFPDRARRLMPSEPGAAGRPVPDASGEAPDASIALPELLVRPPWARPAPRGVPGLRTPPEQAVVWEPGERERWAAEAAKWRPEVLGGKDPEAALAKAIDAVRAGAGGGIRETMTVFLHAPDDIVDTLVPGWEPYSHDFTDGWIRPFIARFGLGAREVALRFALRPRKDHAQAAREALLPFRDAEVAERMAGWLAREVEPLGPVRDWFGRHGAAAVPLLVPAALGRPGARRRRAEHALRFVAELTDPGRVAAAAGEHGEAVRRLLAEPAPPPEPPKIPAWAAPGVLPRVRLRDRDAVLPDEAAGHLVTALALAAPGLDEVREACDPASLAGFAWALFERWLAEGAPPGDGWALRSLGLVGDDDGARRLAPLVREWAGTKKLHDRAVKGLEVLVAIGTPVALLHLHEMRRKGGASGVREAARTLFGQVAARAHLTVEGLSERIVPDYGLDADGGTTLDYGPRRFRVGFGGSLEPYVADHAGRPLKALPEPGAGDDLERAEAARRRFTAMKAEVRTASTYLVERLEKAMIRRRSWRAEEFRALFAEHPLVRHIARRLVWTADGAAFRIAEDRTFADVHDDAFVLPGTAVVRLAHPAELGGDLDAWAETFADYGLDQPFRQLGRPFHLLTEDERAAGRMTRFEGRVVDGGRVHAMERRRWSVSLIGRDGHPGGDLAAVLLAREDPDARAVEVTVLRWHVPTGLEHRIGTATVGTPDPAFVSEAVADLLWLVG